MAEKGKGTVDVADITAWMRGDAPEEVASTPKKTKVTSEIAAATAWMRGDAPEEVASTPKKTKVTSEIAAATAWMRGDAPEEVASTPKKTKVTSEIAAATAWMRGDMPAKSSSPAGEKNDKKSLAEELKKELHRKEIRYSEVERLLKAGANEYVNTQMDSLTLLMMGVKRQDAEAIKLLVKYGGDINHEVVVKTKNGEKKVSAKSLAEAALKKAQKANNEVAIKKAQDVLKALGVQKEEVKDKKSLAEELKKELHRKEIRYSEIERLLKAGANEYVNTQMDSLTLLMMGVKRQDAEAIKLLVKYGGDINHEVVVKTKNGEKKVSAKSLAEAALKKAQEANDEAAIKKAQDVLNALGVQKDQEKDQDQDKDKEQEQELANVPSLKRNPDEKLADWYTRVAKYWAEQEAKVNEEIKNEKDQTKKTALENKAKHQKLLAEKYGELVSLEAQLEKETDPAKRKELITKLTRTSSSLMSGVPAFYATYLKDQIADKNNPYVVQRDTQSSELLNANAQYQEALKALNNVKVNDTENEDTNSQGARGDKGNNGDHGSSVEPAKKEVTVNPEEVDPTKTKPGEVTPAIIDAVAQAKHDGSQEKSWWERNQEWIWWVLGIVVAAVLGFFAFRKGGWLNKDKKKDTVVNTNTNTNTNTNDNTNSGTDNNNSGNGGTGNENSGSGTDGNTGTGTNNGTLETSGYSVNEINAAIAANLPNIIKDR